MKYYLAPLESITTYIYRNAQAAVYGPLDKYFIPFLEPHEKRTFKTRELMEILPEHNEGLNAVPQILTNQSEGFLRLARALKEMGYEEINLNLGCPSRTVVSKHKGSGFLALPEELDRFLDEIFSGADVKISIKTRIGKDSPEEFPGLLEIYNQYPLSELIIHPRVQQDYYKNEPRMDVFREALLRSRAPVCYNGDLFSGSRVRAFEQEFPQADSLMCGRGILIDPGLLRRRREQPTAVPAAEEQEEIRRKADFMEFHRRIVDGYRERDLGDRNVLFKMKELWVYQVHLFEDPEKYWKRIKKTQSLQEYEEIVGELFAGRKIRPVP